MSDDENSHAEDDWKKIIKGGFGNIDQVISGAGGRDSGAIKHAEDAIDYADEDLSDEDLPDEEDPSGNNPISDNDNDDEFNSLMNVTDTKQPSIIAEKATNLPVILNQLPTSNVTETSSINVQGISHSPSLNTTTIPPGPTIPTDTNIWGNPEATNPNSVLMFSASDSLGNLTTSIATDFFSVQQNGQAVEREMSLEERIGSDYAEAVSTMTFDDDWFTGGIGSTPVTSSVVPGSTFPAFDTMHPFSLPGSTPVTGAGVIDSIGISSINNTLPLVQVPIGTTPDITITSTTHDLSNGSMNTTNSNNKTLTEKTDNVKTTSTADNKGPSDKDLLKRYFPDFQKGKILKMNSIFGPRGRTLALPRPKNPRPTVPTRVNLEIEPDQKSLFQRNKQIRRLDHFYGNITEINSTTAAAISDSVYKMREDLEKMNHRTLNPQREEENILIATANWDLDHLWMPSSEEELEEIPVTNAIKRHTQESEFDSSDEESDEERPLNRTALTNSTSTARLNHNHTGSKPIQKRANNTIQLETDNPSKRVKIYHPDMYNSEDEESFFEGVFNYDKPKVILDLNDNRLLFADDTQTLHLTSIAPRRQQVVSKPTEITNKNILQRYNISNDRAYDLLKENYQSKVRSIISELNIDHSMVSQRLQSPHYKVKLSKEEMRSFHRPVFNIKPGTVIHFSKIRQRKRKRDKGKPIVELLSKTTDLTLGDSAQFFLLEYSEEFPLVLSNFGMGNKLINYYRKTNPDDRTRPKLATGETNVLGVEDKSAFWNFGFIEPGNVVPALYNKMIRAPIFKHDPKSTDFLLVRSTGGGQGTKFFLRSIPFLFTVGQTFPVTPIPGPHSRKVTTASKNRLKMVVFRLLNKDEHQRINVKDISPHFPDHNEMQNRQRLKEFMVFQRTGNDYSYWKIKPSETLPNEESIRSMITPEDITLLEAMQVGQQHLEDAGYGKTVEDDDDENEGTSIEEQLAPWNITRNFINATQGKAMLQLHGEGDPSGSGEAFSFLRTSMKGGFRAMGESVNERLDKSKFGGHSYNVALQQKAYDDEIKRIWYTQTKSLSNPNSDHLTWDETESTREGEGEDNVHNATINSVAGTPQPKGDTESLFSHASGTQQNKILRITRFVRDENGTVQRQVEIVDDPNLIRAYVKRRQKIEDELMAQRTDEIAPTNDGEKNKRHRKILEQELAKLQRNQDRRMVRRAIKAGLEPPKKSVLTGTSLDKKSKSNKGVGKGKSTTRKCATCGAIGHIRTNKSCPMYNERYGSGNENQANSSSASTMPQNPSTTGTSGSALL